ncbi:MAG TPA: ATP-binding protein [Acidimicrobiia bacterium]|nr:ATP-binding protein [Acidimicrobiia bacterium]
MHDALRAVPLFQQLADEDLERLAVASAEVSLEPDQQLFAEGDPGSSAYVITGGEIEIVKAAGGREVRLAIRRPGEVIGEMALVRDSPRSATARAFGGRSTLIAIPKSAIDHLMMSSIDAVRGLFRVLLDRWESTQALLSQSERMAQLGTLTAGLAHELNNPAAAVSRATVHLRRAISALTRSEEVLAMGLERDAAARFREMREQVRASSTGDRVRLDALARSDLEDEIERRLRSAGVEDAWNVAAAVVDLGATEYLDEILNATGPAAGAAFDVIRHEHDVSSLLYEVEEGTRRLSAIVGALKSYVYLDQAPVQDVDVARGIEDTLLILKSKLEDIEVRTEFSESPIEGRGGELNQVWTNLLDNAAYAIHESGRTDGLIVVRAFDADDTIVVEVEDNGVGIPPENIHRVFDSFFTTKPPGSGTGLGLQITRSIVVDGHGGTIDVESDDGRTVFRVELPMRDAAT